MPKRLETRIWLSGKSYLFSALDENGEVITPEFKADSPEYFAWIAGLTSFHFEGKEGRFTARRETRKNKGGTIRSETYWSAYRKHNHKQLRKYLGTSDKLSIATLEDTAKDLTDRGNALPAKIKTPRKKPIHRAVLMARIAEKDKIIEQLQAENQQLKDELTAVKIQNAKLLVANRERQL
jgi:hypothetical protein